MDVTAAELFRHVSVERAPLYRAVLSAFAAAKRQFRLHLRPDEVRAEASWPHGERPSLDEVQKMLAQLVEWGNLRAQADTARVATIEDFYRAKFLYQLSREGEAVETGLAAFTQALVRRAELQTVALEDIQTQLVALQRLSAEQPLDAARIHQTLRELVHVFEGLADNAEDFMAGLARTVELQAADAATVVAYKDRLIDYLERFIGDLVAASGRIAETIAALEPPDQLLRLAAAREARDAAPGEEDAAAAAERALAAWQERWAGLRGWFLRSDAGPSQAQRLRARARAAIPRLLAAIARVNERRTGRSDRTADYRMLARWFADTADAGEAHRLWRAAFALSPARHLALGVEDEVAATTPWAAAPAIVIEPTLRERGRLPSAGGPPRVRDRSAEKAYLADKIAAEDAQLAAARERLASDGITRLSELGRLDRHAFALFLTVLGEALAAMRDPQARIERLTTDGSLALTLEPIVDAPIVTLETDAGRFSGRDHWLHVRTVQPAGGE